MNLRDLTEWLGEPLEEPLKDKLKVARLDNSQEKSYYLEIKLGFFRAKLGCVSGIMHVRMTKCTYHGKRIRHHN